MVWYGRVQYGTDRTGSVRYGTVWYGTVRYGTVQYGTVRYGMIGYCMVACSGQGLMKEGDDSLIAQQLLSAKLETNKYRNTSCGG